MKSNLFVSSACLAGALVALAACNNDTPTGSLTVPFQLGANSVCTFKDPAGADVAVETITMRLYRPGTVETAEEPVAEEQAPCSDGEIVFGTIDAARYTVVAEAKVGDKVVFDNGGSVEEDVVEVLEGQEVTADSVRLTLTPVKVLLQWSFGFGNSQCSQIPMKNLEITTLRDDGNSELGAGGVFSCDQPLDIGNYRLLADPDRSLNGNDLDTIEIVPTDAAGKAVGTFVTYQFPEPGPGGEIRLSVVIDCSDTACDLACKDGTCTPDP